MPDTQSRLNSEVFDILKHYGCNAQTAENGLADALTDYKGYLAETFTCETCRERLPLVEKSLDEECDICTDCRDIYVQNEMAYWRSLYEGEKAAGLLKSDAEYRQDMIDAGRGRQVR